MPLSDFCLLPFDFCLAITQISDTVHVAYSLSYKRYKNNDNNNNNSLVTNTVSYLSNPQFHLLTHNSSRVPRAAMMMVMSTLDKCIVLLSNTLAIYISSIKAGWT